MPQGWERQMNMFRSTILMLVLVVVTGGAAFAGAHPGKTGISEAEFARNSGFRGHEEALGAAVAKAILETSPTRVAAHDFSGRERELGLAVETVIKTLNNREPYQHETNDALVKAHLTAIQFAKNNGLLNEYINHQALTQSPMLSRVGELVRKTGNTKFALLAMTERTACFYQLVSDYQIDADHVRWRSPYGNVLAQTYRLGQNDFSEAWLHENYTVPLMRKQAAVMGLDVEVSGWQDDGWITMRVLAPEAVAAN